MNRKLISVVISVLIILNSSISAWATDSKTFDKTFFNLNGINYYDGHEECIPNKSSSILLSGSTEAEKIWNFLRSQGFSEQATAGIMGNFFAESGYDSKRLQDGGPAAGLAQWENYATQSGRWANMANYARSKGVDWTDLQAQLEWVIKELEGEDPTTASILNSNYGGLEGLKKMTDIRQAVEAFEKSFERAGIPRWEVRYQAAEEAYETFKGTSAGGSGDSSSSSSEKTTNDGSFTFIGDSITESARSKLTSAFPNSSVNAYIGRGIAQAGISGDSVLDFLEKNQSNLGRSIIINIGTNDNFPVDQAKKMLNLLQGKKVFIVNNFGLGGNANFEAINNNIKSATEGNGYVTVLDWKSEVEKNGGREKNYASDGYHLNAEGENLYIEFLKKSISEGALLKSGGCDDGLSSGNSSNIAERAIELAHPDGQESRGYAFEVSDKQRQALEKTGLINYGEPWVQKGASCDAFVSMVISTTVDPEFVKHCCGVANLRDYMSNNPEKYDKITYSRENLKPGDIITAGRGGGAGAHIEIYVEIGGEGKVANAGWSRTTGVIEPLNLSIMESLGEVEIWRWKG
ncbi:MAG: phage tail tip lysozyme [bacterium]|nr:phage tail tip lysozyme [bacterium]